MVITYSPLTLVSLLFLFFYIFFSVRLLSFHWLWARLYIYNAMLFQQSLYVLIDIKQKPVQPTWRYFLCQLVEVLRTQLKAYPTSSAKLEIFLMPSCWSVKSSVENIPKVVIEHVLKSNDLIKDTNRNWSNRLMTPCWIKFVYKRLKINMYKLCPYYILLSVSEILWKTQFHERSLWRHIEDQSHIQLKTNGTKDNQIYWHYRNTRNTCLKKIRQTFTLVIIEDRTKQCASKKKHKRMLYTFYMTFTSIQIIWKNIVLFQ